MKDLGILKYFLGVEVARNQEEIFLSKRKYVLDIIFETGLLGAKSVGFPMEQNQRLAGSTSPLMQDCERYLHVLSQFLHEQRQDHWSAALRVVKYLKDWASCPLTRRSVSGWIVFLGDSPISWKTKKHVIVSRSSAEAEYRSMDAVTCELKWLKGLLQGLGVSHTRPIGLYCDSQSALYLAQNSVFHERTKHIEIDCHFLRDALMDDTIATAHVSTNEQLADIFTKALGKRQFEFLLRELGIHDLHALT
ncbi:transmembrane signal receptor [Lithospermum erythrorhizon]|uniref:Transmembrane signal receptor n=1 Tax=Lithospermum erythrorhizon TaxID=34254 RepID=A0AAV3PNF3_LITER